jgi:uncharacterized phage-associated protein
MKKLITVINFIANKIPNICKLKLMKVLYFADKEHLLRYGDFITDDNYKKLPYGPIHSFILNLVDNPEIFIFDAVNLRYFHDNIDIDDKPNRNLKSKKNPDLMELSDSEIEVLDYICEKYEKFSPGEMIEITHRENFWEKKELNSFLSVEDIVDGAPEELIKDLLEYYKENQKEKEFCN